MIKYHFKPQLLWLFEEGPSAQWYHPWWLRFRQAEILTNIGRWRDADGICQQLYEFALGLGRDLLAAEAGNQWAMVLRRLGRYQESLEVLYKSAEILKSHGRAKDLGLTLVNIGNIYYLLDDLPKAQHLYKQAIEKSLGDESTEFNAQGNLGLILLRQGKYDQALECFLPLKARAEASGNKKHLALVVANMGNLFDEMGDFRSAIDCYRLQISISRECGDLYTESVGLGNLGKIHLEFFGDQIQALALFRRYLEIATRIGDLKGACIAQGNIGLALQSVGQLPQAEQAYLEAISLGYRLDIRYLLCSFHYYYADLLFSRGDLDAAEEQRSIAQGMAEQVSRQDILFLSALLGAKIMLSKEPSRGLEPLMALLDQYPGMPEKAFILYELATATGEEKWRRQAKEVFTELYRGTPKYEYKSKLESLDNIDIIKNNLEAL